VTLPVLQERVGTLRSVELWEAETTLRVPVGTSLGTHLSMPALYVRVVTEESEGWGEVAAIDAPVGSDPSLSAVALALESRWLPRIVDVSGRDGGRSPESHAVMLLGSSTPIDHVAGSAVEAAILDASLRRNETSLVSWMGFGSRSVPYGAVIGIPEDHDVDTVVEVAQGWVQLGARRLRVKIEPGFSVSPLAALRSEFPQIDLHADANGSFALDGAAELRELDPLGLRCIEQPLGTRDLAACATLAQSLETPICLDESITSRRAARDAVRYGACRVLCLKPARLGGIRSTLAILTMAQEEGVSCFLGGMFETGLGRALLGALAAHPAASLISDVVAPSRYLEVDPCDLAGPESGVQPLHLSPGIGPWPAPQMRRLWFTLSI